MTLTVDPLTNKLAVTIYPVIDLIRERYSPRVYSSDPIPVDVLASLFEAAQWAPSSRNAQPWRFIYATQDEPEAFERLYNLLKESNQQWAGDAYMLVLLASEIEDETGRQNGKAIYDAGQAMAYLTMQATANNLYMRQMGGFYYDRAAEELNLPDNVAPVVMAAIGYRGAMADAPEAIQQRESMPRHRISLGELVYHGEWGSEAGL